MITAKVFTSGNSQAVRLPKGYRLDVDEVSVNRIGNILLLIPKGDPWSMFSQGVREISDDFPSAIKKVKHTRKAAFK
jgi:antitoxin VapB